MEKVKNTHERLWYIHKTIENGWSRNVLALQIASKLYSREGKALTNFKTTLPPAQSELVQQIFKNPYKRTENIPLTDAEREKPLDSDAFFRILALTMDDNATIVCDTGDALIGAIGLRTTAQSNFIADAYYLSMGFAVPAAIGAMAAKPDSRVYCLVGDGAFQMTGMELSTCAKYGMHPIVCILNNDGYGTQRHIIDGPFNNIHRWEYAKIRDVLNYGKSVKVQHQGELEKALKDAAASNEMHIIEVIIPRDDCSQALRRMASNLGNSRDINKRH